MPKPSDYTPARRRTMQVLMWVLLAATVGLASVVGRANRRANHVELGPHLDSAGDVTVRLPQRWRALPRGDDPRTVARATDNAGDEHARQVEVLLDTVESPVSPIEYLSEQFQLPVPRLAADGADEIDDGFDVVIASGATVAGRPGVMVTLDGGRLRQGLPDFPPKEVYAATILPSRRAIVIRLRGIGRPDVTDRTVVRQIAEAIEVKNEPRVARAESSPAPVTLPHGTSLTPPGNLRAVEQRDPLRTDRLLWPALAAGASAQEIERGWTTLELVECLIPQPADPDAQATLATILLTRDTSTWRDAKIERAGPDTWRAGSVSMVASGHSGPRPRVASAGVFVTRAYLRTDPSGRALLAIFRGGMAAIDGDATDASAADRIDAAWKTVSESIRFGPPPQVERLQAAGADAADRLRKAGFESLIAERNEQWWLWTDASDRPHRGWSHLDFDVATPGAVHIRTELRLRRGGGTVRRVTGDHRYADASAQYKSDVTSADAQGSESQSFQQSVTLRDGKLALSAKTTARPLAQWSVAVPPHFVPGGLLPLVMDELAGEAEPLMLRAESFLGFEALGAPQPLAILVSPIPPPTTRPAEGEDQPMRCVEVEVNGSGQVSRWYFRRGGEVERIELPGGVQRVASDSKTIGFDFGKDPLMAP